MSIRCLHFQEFLEYFTDLSPLESTQQPFLSVFPKLSQLEHATKLLKTIFFWHNLKTPFPGLRQVPRTRFLREYYSPSKFAIKARKCIPLN